MDPGGYFRGNTVHASWQEVNDAQSYSVSIEQCNDESVCTQVYHSLQSETRLVATSKDFEPCTIYTLKVIAVDEFDQRLVKETALMRKSANECNHVLELSLTVTISLLVVLALAILASVVYYHRRKPIQRLQRARSRVYSKLYPREKYERPYSKDEFVRRLLTQAPNEFIGSGGPDSSPTLTNLKPDLPILAEEDHLESAELMMEKGLSRFNSVECDRKSDFLAEEFCELEQLAFDTIQRRTAISSPPVNRKRNRYQDIVPFDATRVALEKPVCVEGETEASDFINASYISDISAGALMHTTFVGIAVGNAAQRKDSSTNAPQPLRTKLNLSKYISGFRNQRQQSKVLPDAVAGRQRPGLLGREQPEIAARKSVRYIAAQGPGEETTPLFWEMIWQQNVHVIVMLTKLVEGFGFNSIKCAMYWPNIVGGVRRFSDLEVQLYDVQEAPDYKVHKLELSRRSLNVSREIVHIQCTSWPDRSAPENASSLLQLIEVTRALSKQYNDTKDPGPWLVHCSAGVGRTGTFIAVDQLLRMIDDEKRKEIDIFNLVYQLRKDRRYMVQTQAQYAYVYKCVFEYFRRKEDKRKRESSPQISSQNVYTKDLK